MAYLNATKVLGDEPTNETLMCFFFNFWTLWMKLCTRLLFGRTNMQTERDTHTNANEIKLKKHETHHCHDSQMEHELRTLLLMTFEMHICLQFRSGSQRHPFWHRWIHHWVDTIWPSPDPWSCAVNVWKLGGQHELVKLCKMKNNTIICFQLRRSNHVIWHKIWSNGTELFFFTWIQLVSARNIVLWQRLKWCIVNYNNETFDMVNDATRDKFSFNIFTTSENSKIWYIALILFCCDLFGCFYFSNPCIVRCYIGKIWQIFGSGPALRLKKWVYRTVTTAVFIDWTHVEIAFIWLRFLTQMNSNDGSGWFDLFWSAGQRQNRVWCPSFGECDVSQGIGIISVECTASTIKQPGRATHSVMGQIHSQNPKPVRDHILGHFNSWGRKSWLTH